MEEFQFEINYNNIKHITDISGFPNNKALLYIFHANKIPPHIGWSQQGQFYSLKASGVDIGLDILKINHIILKKQIPTLIIELEDIDLADRNPNKIFLKYKKGLKKGETCLNPIDQLLFNQVKHEKIGDLLMYLFESRFNLIYYGVNLPLSFGGILNYTKHDIEKRIIELQ